MNRGVFLILFGFIFYLATDISYAGAVLYRVQQTKAMKQHQAQAEYQKYQQSQQQGEGQQAPEKPTYQQTVDQRNQSISKAILDAHHQTGDIQGHQQTKDPGSDVKDVVDLSEVWKKLDTKSTVWQLLIDDQAKALTVSEYIDRFRQQGVKINQPPLHYVQMVDQIATDNPQILQRPFGELLQVLAILDYDFDNGINKDDLARKVLGEEGFEANKKRFSQKQ